VHAQKTDVVDILARARRLGKCTMVGGPYASSEPEALLPLADHVVVSEPDEVFSRIATDLETGLARRLYVIHKPDVSKTPTPRFDLLKLQALVDFGWRKPVFVADDNFIGNYKLALELAQEMEAWQQARDYPLMFFTEASIDLAQRPELIEAMVKANFFFVFIGIESPAKGSLTEAKKFQNLRLDPLESIRFIQGKGLWVCGGFILGFDGD